MCNLAPFSCPSLRSSLSLASTHLFHGTDFAMCSHNPPMVMVSFTHPSATQLKDSAANILETKNFTANIISEVPSSLSLPVPPTDLRYTDSLSWRHRITRASTRPPTSPNGLSLDSPRSQARPSPPPASASPPSPWSASFVRPSPPFPDPD